MAHHIAGVWRIVVIVVTLAVLAYASSTAYASSRVNGSECQFCSSQTECNNCCIAEDFEGGVCTMAGVCLCF